MGRRALPKIDPSVDFSQHLFELVELPSPWDRTAWFPDGDSRPLEIEIGSGKGLFMLNESGARTDTDFVGLEISRKYCGFAAYKLASAGRTNARMIRGDAIDFIRRWVADASVQAIHIYFPDPWWKERHRRRRVVRDDSLEQIARVLVPGGRLHFWTDVEEYFETGCDIIQASSAFDGPIPDTHSGSSDTTGSGDQFHTHFERRMLVNEHDVFRCKFVRRQAILATSG